MSPGLLRVAAAQAESRSGDLAANVATAVTLVQRAAEAGARVVVLPELFLTGYDPDAWSAETCTTPEDARLGPLAQAAAAHGCVVVAGAALAPDRLSLLVFDDRGGVHHAYDKQHLFDSERGFFTAGDHGATLEVDGWQLGLGICYDGCFPEHAAAAAADGATAYLCPSAYFVGSEHRRDLYYAARALDNGIYVVFAGLTGRCGAHAFNGGSAVYDPEGRPLGRVGDEAPAIVVADLDPAEVARVRELNPIGRDRVADLGRRARLRAGDGQAAALTTGETAGL
ncbi:MAG: carbon-nitrogen hydrolase family protein [Nocardioidaceae bacterium]